MKIERVLFIGSKLLGLKCLKEIAAISKETLVGVLTIDDRSDGRTQFEEFKNFCTEKDIPFHVAGNRKESEEIVLSQNASLCIVIGWYWLLRKELLGSVEQGFIGVHNSLLPKYRGGSPLVWSIINGEKEVGFSMFSFTEGMDEGDIWFQESIELKPNDSIKDMLLKIEERVVLLLRENYEPILNGKLTPKPQNSKEATYCAQRMPEDGIINWSMPAQSVYNFIRAQSEPYPGAFTIYKERKMIIWDARISDEIHYGTIGQVARVSPDGVHVICGDNKAIIIKEIEYENHRTAANHLIKSFKTRFGSPYFMIN